MSQDDGTWYISQMETGALRRQYMAVMELLGEDVFASDDPLYILANDRAGYLGRELDERFSSSGGFRI